MLDTHGHTMVVKVTNVKCFSGLQEVSTATPAAHPHISTMPVILHTDGRAACPRVLPSLSSGTIRDACRNLDDLVTGEGCRGLK
jgi:hypothetical protein